MICFSQFVEQSCQYGTKKKIHPSSKSRNLVQCVFAPWCWGVLPSTKLVVRTCRYLVHCLQADLNNYMPAFLDDPEEHNPQRPKIGKNQHTLVILSFLLLQHFEKDSTGLLLSQVLAILFSRLWFLEEKKFCLEPCALRIWLGKRSVGAKHWCGGWLGSLTGSGLGTIPNFLTHCQFQYFGFDTDSRVMLFYRNRCFKTSFSKNKNTLPLHAVHKTFILRFYWGFELGFPPDEVVFFKTSLKQMLLRLLWQWHSWHPLFTLNADKSLRVSFVHTSIMWKPLAGNFTSWHTYAKWLLAPRRQDLVC